MFLTSPLIEQAISTSLRFVFAVAVVLQFRKSRAQACAVMFAPSWRQKLWLRSDGSGPFEQRGAQGRVVAINSRGYHS